ncbi:MULTISPECIES: TetR/AcrR family transcriptional regulator [Ruegeria]|uniref:TetR/AcrR family transcriptional regulator n=1 Tax=Ruegeria TaxID=97050 RepID=UPI00147CA283|nr:MULTISPECIES: TetR/AcrR family transcriptional regulator [Ruegeria]MBO9411322.1 helix-turn-helix transcriptional regulator [Ruegeria sp. R8_1]MBO9415523.1 helix-turn-helix transcriptional regulator [Ruegeria sp. R8_2]
MSKATLENYVLDDKCLTILDSALQAFSAYGFKKTSMDDIAKGAGMSRPALYLHFQNKEAILRQLTHLHYERKTAAVAEALNMEGSVSQIIGNAIHVQTDGMAEIMSSPHGLELLDASVSTAADIVTQGEAQLMALYADWLRREAEKGRVRLFDGPRETAKMIASALRGIKTSASDYQEFIRSNSNLATVIGAGIEVT